MQLTAEDHDEILTRAADKLAAEMREAIAQKHGTLYGATLVPLNTAAMVLGLSQAQARRVLRNREVSLGERQTRYQWCDIEEIIATRKKQ